MKIYQVYEIVNSLAEQSMGITDLTPTDASFVAVGDTLINNDDLKDPFYRALFDLIGRTVIAIRAYKSKRRSTMFRDPFEYGAMVRKISYTMPEAQINPTWYPVTQQSASLQDKTPLTIRQYLFHGLSTWEVPGTVPDVQLKNAFRSAEEMAAFISGIFTNMQNRLEVDFENMSNTALGSFIASIVNSGNTTCAINLLEEYNALGETTTPLTVANCLSNMRFLRYAGKRIKDVSDCMEVMSTTFNIVGQERFTDKNLQVLEVLSQFASAIDTYLQSDVFHNELTKLPYYTTVPYWQGSGKDWSFANVSAIDLTVEGANGDSPATEELKATGVLAVLRDRDSVGTTIDNRRTRSFVDTHNEVTNYWEKADIMYVRDQSENGVVFYVA